MDVFQSGQSRVPQGSVLGPLLFVIFVNDNDDCMASKILKFADDTQIYRTVISQQICSPMWSDLSNLVAWPKER